jgi:alpha-beta hydrolase superfamily lysophospholipase
MKRLIPTLLVVFAAYAGICAFLLLSQNRLLYVGAAYRPHPPGLTLPTFTTASGETVGFVASPAGTPRGTIVFYHGNGEEAWRDDTRYGPYFTSRGYRVVFAEYPGYDMRKGEHPTHDLVIADAIATARQAAQDYPGTPIWIAGNSLGAGIAAQVAGVVNPPRVLLFVPWDNFAAVAQDHYRWLPAALLIRLDGTNYDSCAALQGQGAHVFITYAGLDHVIPPRHARALAACLNVPPTQVVELPAAWHINWDTQLSSAQWDTLLAPP